MRSPHAATLALLLLAPGVKPVRAQQSPAPETSTPSQTPTQAIPGVYRVGGEVTAPKVLFQPEPQFSEKARKKKMSGSCKLSLVVQPDGSVRDVHVVRSIAEDQPKKMRDIALSLDQKAIEAVQQYRFSPAMKNGQPVPVSMTVEVNFQIF